MFWERDLQFKTFEDKANDVNWGRRSGEIGNTMNYREN